MHANVLLKMLVLANDAHENYTVDDEYFLLSLLVADTQEAVRAVVDQIPHPLLQVSDLESSP